MVAGRLNKQIAYDLGTVEKTIKFHRSAIMKKAGRPHGGGPGPHGGKGRRLEVGAPDVAHPTWPVSKILSAMVQDEPILAQWTA